MQDFISCQATTARVWQPEQIEALAKSTEQYPVDFEDAWVWIGYSQKIHAKAALERNFIENIDFSRSIEKSSGGRPPERIFLTADCFKQFCMMAGTTKVRNSTTISTNVSKNSMTLSFNYNYLEEFFVGLQFDN